VTASPPPGYGYTSGEPPYPDHPQATGHSAPGGYAPYHAIPRQRSAPPSDPRNGFGTASLVLGVIGLVFAFIPLIGMIAWPLVILGLVFGVLAVNRARTGAATNRGVAIAGTICSAVGLVVCILWLAAFGAVSSLPTSSPGAEQPLAPVQSTGPPAPGGAESAASSGPRTAFGDGFWVVGEEIVPGTYKSNGAQAGVFEFCMVTTYAGDDETSNILNIASANADEPMRIKLSGKVKGVKVSGCEDFTKVA
jgi:hypothetical protein